MPPFRPLAAALVFLSAACPAVAQTADGASDFTVFVETPDGEPIAGASVLVGDRGASTDAEGRAVVGGMAPGRYRLRVSFLGRGTRELAARLEAPGPWGLVVEMAPSVTELADVVVEARDLSRSRLARDGFFHRLNLGAGTVLTAEDLYARHPLTLADAVRGVLGVRVLTGPEGTVAVSQRAGTSCALSVYLDGAPYGFASRNLDAIPAHDLVAVEVYRRPSQVPVQYNQLGASDGSGGCGVILAWTSFSMAER